MTPWARRRPAPRRWSSTPSCSCAGRPQSRAAKRKGGVGSGRARQDGPVARLWNHKSSKVGTTLRRTGFGRAIGSDGSHTPCAAALIRRRGARCGKHSPGRRGRACISARYIVAVLELYFSGILPSCDRPRMMRGALHIQASGRRHIGQQRQPKSVDDWY